MRQTTILHSAKNADRIIYSAEDPFPAPRPLKRTMHPAYARLRSRSAHRRLTANVVIMVAAIALVAIAVGGALSVASTFQSDLQSTHAATPTSTPKSAWKKGEVPYLYQTDAAWADRPYAQDTVGKSGCGPTCLSMVYIALTGNTDRDPASMCAFSQINGYVEQGMTRWLLMTEGAKRLGLTSREIPSSASMLVEELEAGHPLIASVSPGDFTTEGHFIVIAGIADDGTLVIHDPNSVERSSMTWDASRVLGQCVNLWSFSC